MSGYPIVDLFDLVIFIAAKTLAVAAGVAGCLELATRLMNWAIRRLVSSGTRMAAVLELIWKYKGDLPWFAPWVRRVFGWRVLWKPYGGKVFRKLAR